MLIFASQHKSHINDNGLILWPNYYIYLFTQKFSLLTFGPEEGFGSPTAFKLCRAIATPGNITASPVNLLKTYLLWLWITVIHHGGITQLKKILYGPNIATRLISYISSTNNFNFLSVSRAKRKNFSQTNQTRCIKPQTSHQKDIQRQ